jgi:hypothetical protein
LEEFVGHRTRQMQHKRGHRLSVMRQRPQKRQRRATAWRADGARDPPLSTAARACAAARVYNISIPDTITRCPRRNNGSAACRRDRVRPARTPAAAHAVNQYHGMAERKPLMASLPGAWPRGNPYSVCAGTPFFLGTCPSRRGCLTRTRHL